jgi:putative hydrolase of HD superfamily
LNPETTLTFLRQALVLKCVPRSGWTLRGVAAAESVAEHTWGTALVTLVLAEGAEESLDREKALTIALLHDLPERVLSDIPSPAMRYFPDGAKHQAEENALEELLSTLPDAARLREWWLEFENRTTPEGRLVRDADRLEMLLQALAYEESRGCRLDDFWETQEERPFHFAVAREVYQALVRSRAETLRQRATT